ncbi:RNA polymerase sigma factor [Duganella violaceipulchra]|uniref:RNA polymerase sigma factor n=1 Tax=Duganella violaceipulchra TaxID=2849652 RepID=A0AA41H606_9BURK|nr:RNA polymerase sigma factor [Duganella violaceicalia]MBV6322488.1 RNA polymerase sigma factor [Duganella violaceicalia]MCP2010695.1 RNA polymerase sigma factor (sigma-70 family) [Duganella violaceicalia]
MDAELDSKQQQVMAYIRQIARMASSDSSRLRRFLWRYERTSDNQDDIIQDAILEALRCRHHYLALGSVQTWFYGVLANVARNHVARRVKQSLRTDSLDLWQDSVEHAAEAEQLLDSGEQGPEQEAEFRQLAARLFVAAKQLPPDLRTTLELVCLDGHSYHSAASMLLIPVGTVRSRINRARQLLRRKLDVPAS